MESETIKNIKIEETNNVVSLKKKGDEFFKQRKFNEALKCYNNAIEQDESNLDLLMCRARTFYKKWKYSKCVTVTEKIVSLCTNKERCDPLRLFRALKLKAEAIIAESIRYSWDHQIKLKAIARNTFEQAMQIDVPANEMETLIKSYNNSLNRCCDPGSKEALEFGSYYFYGNRQRAIAVLTKAVENPSDPLAYPLRAVCYAEDANCEEELLADVKKCIELDYRNIVYLIKKVEEFKLFGQISASFRLLKALSSSIETYKLSVGKFFASLLDGKALKKSEIKRFKDLEESWREFYLFRLQQLDEEPDFDPQSDYETDSSSTEAADSNSVAEESEHILHLQKEGDEFCEEKKFDESLDQDNNAIELDKSNIDILLCKAQVHFGMKNYSECIKEAERFVALHDSDKKECNCLPVFTALRLIGWSKYHLGYKSSAIEAFEQLLQIDVPVARIEQSINYLNKLTKGCNSYSASIAVLNAGFMHYSRGDRCEAIREFTQAIQNDKSNPLAYACRAICYAEDPEAEQNLVSDIKDCIELDYRFINYFLDVNLANEMTFLGDVSFGFRLYKAVSLSGAEFKRSVGRFFPKLLNAELLSESDRRRFNDLDESWRKKHPPTLERLLKL